MSKTLEFKIFCIESYKQANNVSGAYAVNLFKQKGVFDYISSFYDVLHSTGSQYIAEDIGEFLKTRMAD
jgi:hypothetical protein